MKIDELKQKNQWINWNYKENTKIPISAKNQKTGPNPEYKTTWTNFEQAQKNKKAKGVGVVLTNGICGIDIDKRDLKAPVTQEIFELMDTYTEYSPSGNGFHILFTVDMEKIPKDLYSKYYQKNPKNHIECYISGLTNRYFTFTENVIIDKPIEERTEQLLTFLEKYMLRKNPVIQSSNVDLEEISKDIIEIINNSKQAEKFQKLYLYGDTSEYSNDDSSADMTLCCILAYYCGEDFELIDTIFRQSKLYREKWNREDYKNNTIEKAIKKCEGNYYKNGINFRVLDLLKKWKVEKKYSHNDIGMSDLFADIYKLQLVYNVNAKQWYHYDGKVWLEDTGNVIAKQLKIEAWNNLIKAAQKQSMRTEENRTDNMFFRAVQELLKSKKIYLKSYKNHQREPDMSLATFVGYYDEEKQRCYLLPNVIFSEVVKFYGIQGTKFPGNALSTWKYLKEAGRLFPGEKDRNKTRKSINGKLVTFIEVMAVDVFGTEEKVFGDYLNKFPINLENHGKNISVDEIELPF